MNGQYKIFQHWTTVKKHNYKICSRRMDFCRVSLDVVGVSITKPGLNYTFTAFNWIVVNAECTI